jgi:hypothetical protein
MISSSFMTMAVHSRHSSPGLADVVYKETNAHLEPNAYEVERDRRKQELHDRVQLALMHSGFAEAANLRPAFTGETKTSSPCSPPA